MEKEDKQEYFKTYYEKNKEVMGKQSKEWKIKNREAWNSFQRKYARIRYWQKRLENDPTNENIKTMILELKSSK